MEAVLMYMTRLMLTLLLCLGLLPLQAQELLPRDSSRFIALIDSSFAAGHRGDYAHAELQLREAIDLYPSEPAVALLLNNLGGIQLLQGKVDSAIASYSKALERMPDLATARFNRARLFSLSGKQQAAITDYSLLVAKHPKDELYLYQRAMCYMLTKQYDLAEHDLTTIVENNDKSLKARLGFALLETARGRYDEAERLFDFLTSKLAKSPEVYEGRARLYLARGMKGYALRDVNRAFELAKNRPSSTLYRLRAEVQRQLGDERSAKKDDEMASTLERQQDPLSSSLP